MWSLLGHEAHESAALHNQHLQNPYTHNEKFFNKQLSDSGVVTLWLFDLCFHDKHFVGRDRIQHQISSAGTSDVGRSKTSSYFTE